MNTHHWIDSENCFLWNTDGVISKSCLKLSPEASRRANAHHERIAVTNERIVSKRFFYVFFAPFFLFSRTVRQRVGPAALPHSADDDRQAAAPGPSPQPVPQSRRPARPRSSRLHRSGSEFYRVLQRFRGLYWFYSVLLSFTEFSRVLRGFTRFYLVLPSFT